MADQSKLTPELADAVFALLRRGHYAKDAAAYVGIHRGTFYDWLDRGASARKLAEQRPVREAFDTVRDHRAAVAAWRRKCQSEKPYLDFADGVEEARDYGAAWLVEQIVEMCTNPEIKHQKWTGLMTILERTRRDQWGRRSAVEHGTPDGKPFPISTTLDPTKLSDDQLEAMKLLLEQAQPDQ
jgi:hypothetical protein